MKVPDTSTVATWPASKINTTLDRLDKLSSAVTDEFIAAGRGHERPSDYLKKTDPLSLRAQAVSDALYNVRHEMTRRYGPGVPSRLPRGFGPIAALLGGLIFVGGLALLTRRRKGSASADYIGDLDLLDAEMIRR